MPYFPAPPRPSSLINLTEITGGGVLEGWNRDGSYWGKTTLPVHEHTVAWSIVNDRSRNSPYPLGEGLWRPISSYARGVTIVKYNHGSVKSIFRIPNFGPYWSYEGTSWLQYQSEVGPFMEFGDWLPSPMPTNVRNRLDTELLLKVGARKASYGESLAEAHKTVNHLARTTTTVVRALLAARKGQWGRVAKELGVQRKRLKSGQTLSERWLEYSYGWMPLIGDIYDTHDLLTKGFRKEAFIMSSTRTLRDFHSASGNELSSDYRSTTYGNSTVAYRAKVFYKVNDSSLAKWYQLGLINPAEIAWAVVPYSFVVDWFLPVGNFLEALTSTIGVDFIDGFYGTRVSGRYTTRPRWDEDPNEQLISNTVTTVTETFGYRRSKMSSFPTPGLYLKSPFSTNHVFSALALIRQLIR